MDGAEGGAPSPSPNCTSTSPVPPEAGARALALTASDGGSDSEVLMGPPVPAASATAGAAAAAAAAGVPGRRRSGVTQGPVPPALDLPLSLASKVPQPPSQGCLVLHLAGVPLVLWDGERLPRPEMEIARVPSTGSGLDGLGDDFK